MEYKIKITLLAVDLLSKIKDKREQQRLVKRIEKLKFNPNKQGKPLSGKFQGYRSIRALGQRYRIVYRVNDIEEIVTIRCCWN